LPTDVPDGRERIDGVTDAPPQRRLGAEGLRQGQLKVLKIPLVGDEGGYRLGDGVLS
jgi:hypothetical protein